MSSLAVEIALADARDAARAGDYATARKHLDGLATDDLDVLDLRARVQAQDGDLEGAEEAWRALDEIRPGDAAAAAGIAAIDDLRSGRRQRRLRVGALGVFVLIAAITFGATAAVQTSPAPPTDPRVVAPPQPPSRVSPSSANLASAEAAARTFAGTIAIPDVTAQAKDGVVDVSFSGGLFAEGANLTPRGRRVLAALGPKLAGHVREVAVVGGSVAVGGGPLTGGAAVALARAQTAAAVLAENGPPITTYTLTAAEQTRATGTEAARSRSVELRLFPSGNGFLN